MNRVFSGLADHISVSPFLYYNHLSSSSRGTVIMTTLNEAYFISTCVEGFLYGKLCSCTLAKEVQLFPRLGLYSGIFAIYLQCPSKRSGTATILFYAVCLLHALSTVSFVGDLVALILFVSKNSISKNTFMSVVQRQVWTLSPQLQNDSRPMLFCIYMIQTTTEGICDFLGQFILVCINHCTCHPFY